MDSSSLKRICMIVGATLFGFALIILLCIVSFIAGSIRNSSVSQPAVQHISPSANPLSLAEQDATKAMAMLYQENETGEKVFICTATAFEREGKFYRFITAAHCVAKDDTKKQIVRIRPVKYYINFGLPGNDNFYPAEVEAAGYQSDGDDLAILGVYLKKFNPIVQLSPDDAVVGENIFNIAGPLGFGRQLFRGYVSQVTPGRDAPNFLRQYIMVQIHCGGGSSGSAIVSQEKGAIIGVLVAGISRFGLEPYYDVSLVVPISTFHRFRSAVKARNYEHLTPESYKNLTSEQDLDAGIADDAGEIED